MQEAIAHGDILILAVPTKAIREVCSEIDALITEPKLFVHVSKGIEPDSLKRISEMIAEELTPPNVKAVVALSGPSHAEEVVLRHPTTVTAASSDIEAAEEVQELFMNNYFRVYTNTTLLAWK